MTNYSRSVTTSCTLLLSALAAGCDEQTATISDDNALRVASCALSPFELNDISVLFGLMLEQQQGACPGGGLISRTDTTVNTIVNADFCVTADATTLRGSLSSTDVNSNPIEIDLDFAQVSSVDSIGVGAKYDGEVKLQQSTSNTSVTQEITFLSLQKDEIEDTAITAFSYGATTHKLVQSLADSSSTIEYSSRVEQCGADVQGLTVNTPTALTYLSSATSFSAGEVMALADDGTSLTINFSDDNLVINLDSNADQVDDTRLSLSWSEFQGAVAVASRQRDTQTLMRNANIRVLSR